jgi:phage repressor protein C with HTH and peptisase S24 domain
MTPKLRPGQLLLATRVVRRLRPGQVVIINHHGQEKVKRIERIEDNKIFVIGDNLQLSTDSRHFGWLEPREVIARVVWPKISNS